MPKKPDLHIVQGEKIADAHQRIIRMLEAVHEVSAPQKRAIEERIRGSVHRFQVGEDIVREGDMPSSSTALLEGFAARYKALSDGSRQILSFHIPGDVPDLQSLYLKKMDHSIVALNDVVVFRMPHDILFELFGAEPGLIGPFWHSTLVEASVFREWITNVGQRQAKARIAHLLCELVTRMKAVGFVENGALRFPVTQADIADATGISVVHVNRSLQALRAEQLISWKSGLLAVLNWHGLASAGEFDPAYLHLRRRAAN